MCEEKKSTPVPFTVDGSQGSYTADGLGNASMNAYDGHGRLVGDFWQNSDGVCAIMFGREKCKAAANDTVFEIRRAG